MTVQTAAPDIPLRPAEHVMRLSRMGSFHQSRLSFMRILLRRLKRENWTFERNLFDIGADGVGEAVYTAHGPTHSYSLVAFAHDLPPEKRSDRVIAKAWDATFTLFNGVPTRADIDRLSRNVPLQEAGRLSESELSLSRANRSVRLWEYVVSCLAAGQQPDTDRIDDVGYLMRTTAVYGSGKFGAADRETIAHRPEFQAPFQAEMLSVFLTRTFVRDLVEHMAQMRNPQGAVRLSPHIARRMGIGNSTGLGMAPFLLTHPRLLHKWITARETALARVRGVETATPDKVETFRALLQRSVQSVALWNSQHPIQVEKLSDLRPDLERLTAHVGQIDFSAPLPWNTLWLWAEQHLSVEGQELLASLLPEPYGDLVDDLENTMSADETKQFCIDGSQPLADLRAHLENNYGWAFAIDWQAQESQARAWYVSAEKLEPRLGERFEEPIADYEQPLSPGRDASRLYASLEDWQGGKTAAEFLLAHPEHRHILRRIQTTARSDFAEIRDNTIGADVLPIDMLRCKLSFFGAIHFDPRSDRWVRICMFRDAPYPEDIQTADCDFWSFPELTGAAP